jgi:hypothetical protein
MIRAITTATVFAVFAGLYGNAAKADDCQSNTVKGSYGHLATGSLPSDSESGPTPLVTVGLLSFDGKGALTGTATGVTNNGPTPVTISGTYTVTPDCNVTMTATLYPTSSGGSGGATPNSTAGEIPLDQITLQGVVVQHGTRIDAVITGSMSGVQAGSGVFDSVQ